MAGSRKIALITGGNRGLGRAAALAVARTGVDVVLTYRSNAEEAGAVVDAIAGAGGQAIAIRLDTTEFEHFAGFRDELARVLEERWQRDRFDFLINNAGVAATTPLGATRKEDIDLLVDVHFTGVYLLTQELAPMLADGGRVINLSSGLARFVSRGGWSVYAAMKAAVEVLTRYWASELGDRGITVNTIAPGPIGTDFGGGAVRDDPGLRQAMSGQAALGRVGEPDDIGEAIALMLADGFGWVTAQRIEASGGTRI